MFSQIYNQIRVTSFFLLLFCLLRSSVQVLDRTITHEVYLVFLLLAVLLYQMVHKTEHFNYVSKITPSPSLK